MALRAKPTQDLKAEEQINALIEKGGTVATDTNTANGRPMLLQLRLPKDVVQRIDRQRNKRIVPPSRHAWILEALLEKLKKDA